MGEQQTSKETKDNRRVIVKIVLIMINILLICSAIISLWIYSTQVKENKQESQKSAFCATIESMKQISINYLTTELGYAKDWAKYISGQHMTVEDALNYIDQANNQKDRYVHIVDMQTLEAYSAYGLDAVNTVDCYQSFTKTDSDTYRIFIENMNQMYLTDGNHINVLGKYRADDIQLTVISVGTRVLLYKEDGTPKEYLLLRLIPLSSVRNIWVFPVGYQNAEVGIITRSGDYVVPSPSMKSVSFAEFIRGYNFEDDYNKVDELIDQLSDTNRGLLEYKNSKGEECYWYYSGLGAVSGLHIIGCIPVRNLESEEMDWTIILLTCGIILLLALIYGAYFLYMNQKLRETARFADNASNAKTQFLSTMSHDIRTPMNAIIGMTDIALRHGDDPKQVNECLHKVSLASQHLLTLINNILDISKIESGNFVLNPSTFSLDDSIDRLIDIMHIEIENKKIIFDVQRQILYPYVVADELRLNQIFINLLSNAIKYTPYEGHVRLSIREEAVGEERVRVIYSVTDSGIGMSGEFQQQMYEMFTRDKDSRVDKAQGTGLGLAIVKQMVDLMDGKITCDSALGRGTQFTVTLELERADKQERERLNKLQESEVGEDHFEDIRVLVTEDNDLNWEVIHEILSLYDVKCDRAENGQVCVDKMEESEDNTYDLILMDIQMPKMNGRQATQVLRRSNREYVRNIKIYAMTADAFAEDIQECLKAGMNGHIAKPVDIKKVLEVLRKIKEEKKEK